MANDISVRDRFVRGDAAEPPMKFDWFMQKGWATSCPLGPWLVPAGEAPGAQDAAMVLTRNGQVEQDSRTSQMIFSLGEQIAYLSAAIALEPGDIICKGTCAGVGAGTLVFMRCNPDHHGVGVGLGPRAGLNHYAWGVEDIGILGRLGDVLARNGGRFIWGPGRHGAGGDRDPAGGRLTLRTPGERALDVKRSCACRQAGASGVGNYDRSQ